MAYALEVGCDVEAVPGEVETEGVVEVGLAVTDDLLVAVVVDGVGAIVQDTVSVGIEEDEVTCLCTGTVNTDTAAGNIVTGLEERAVDL